MATILDTFNEVHKSEREGTSRYSNPKYREMILARQNKASNIFLCIPEAQMMIQEIETTKPEKCERCGKTAENCSCEETYI